MEPGVGSSDPFARASGLGFAGTVSRFWTATLPLLIVWISLDTTSRLPENPSIYRGFRGEVWAAAPGSSWLYGTAVCWVRANARRSFVRGGKHANAISAGMDGAVYQSGVLRARAVVARARSPSRSLRQLRRSVDQCSASAGAPHAAAPARADCLPPRSLAPAVD